MRDSTEKEIIKMWSDKLKKDAWWVVDGDNYIGPFNKWCDAKRIDSDDVSKPFDITEDGLSDSDIEEVEVFDGNLRLHLMANYLPYIEHTKDDAIAIAKALGVTGEDLK